MKLESNAVDSSFEKETRTCCRKVQVAFDLKGKQDQVGCARYLHSFCWAGQPSLTLYTPMYFWPEYVPMPDCPTVSQVWRKAENNRVELAMKLYFLASLHRPRKDFSEEANDEASICIVLSFGTLRSLAHLAVR
jgi:hypothetical protein